MADAVYDKFLTDAAKYGSDCKGLVVASKYRQSRCMLDHFLITHEPSIARVSHTRQEVTMHGGAKIRFSHVAHRLDCEKFCGLDFTHVLFVDHPPGYIVDILRRRLRSPTVPIDETNTVFGL